MKSRLRYLALVAVGALAFTACGSPNSQPTDTPTTAASQPASSNPLEKAGLASLSGEQLIEKLDQLPIAERSTDFVASIRLDHILVTDLATKTESEVPLNGDEYYLSVAPYVTQTHPCFFHSLTTCLGEQRNTPMELTVTEVATGEKVIDESVTTYDNGFYGFWLPKGKDYEVTFTANGKTGTQIFTTNDNFGTCATELQLV